MKRLQTRLPMRRHALVAALLLAPLRVGAQDAPALARIRDEGLHRSHVLELFDHLTTVIGPRLTGSPAFKQAVDWAAATLRGYGLANVHLEAWPFGRGWTLEQQ